MRRLYIYIFVLFLIGGNVLGDNDAGTQSPFSLGVGARELSLGGSNRAICDESMAPFWNASRLARAKHYSLGVFHSYLFDTDAAYQYLGIVFPTMDYGVFGAGIFRLGIGDIEKRDINNMRLGTFDDSRLAVYLAYAKTISSFDVGLTVTMEHHSIDQYSTTSSPGLNVSVNHQFDLTNETFRNVYISLNCRNLIQPNMKLIEESVKYPIEADLGATLEFKPFKKWNHSALFSTSIVKTDYISPSLEVGLEYSINNMLHLRSGVRKGSYSFGTGISFKGFEFDYAVLERDLGFLHMFTLKTAFGTSFKEKRITRARQREVEFNGIMNDRLMIHNREMVENLVQYGKKMLEDGNLVEANNGFDRALFLTRSSGFDTTLISELADDAARRLEDIYTKQRFAMYMDSAQKKFNIEDYWSAKYFAQMALAEIPNSNEARKIINQSNNIIEETSTIEETIKKQLWAMDSLLNYGMIEEAVFIAENLTEIAPENERIRQTLKEVKFEQYKKKASDEFASRNFDKALTAVDSALILFPGHQWCRNLKKQINKAIDISKITVKPIVTADPESVSPEIEKEAQNAYKSAQEYFKNGDLSQAIKYWKKTERLIPNYQSVRSYLVNAYKFVGVDYYGKNQLEEAVGIWYKAAKLDPDNKEIESYIKRTEAEIQKLKELSSDFR
jgi:tetratricopeptide (TPR) repeat protein